MSCGGFVVLKPHVMHVPILLITFSKNFTLSCLFALFMLFVTGTPCTRKGLNHYSSMFSLSSKCQSEIWHEFWFVLTGSMFVFNISNNHKQQQTNMIHFGHSQIQPNTKEGSIQSQTWWNFDHILLISWVKQTQRFHYLQWMQKVFYNRQSRPYARFQQNIFGYAISHPRKIWSRPIQTTNLFPQTVCWKSLALKRTGCEKFSKSHVNLKQHSHLRWSVGFVEAACRRKTGMKLRFGPCFRNVWFCKFGRRSLHPHWPV